jgi:hypothetical protein
MLTDPEYGPDATYAEIVQYMKEKGFYVDPKSYKTYKDEELAGDPYHFLDDPTSKDKLDYKERVKNFKPNADNITFLNFVNPDTGVVVRDLVPRNFIKTTTGRIVCIDPMFGQNSLPQSQRIGTAIERLTGG